MLGRVILLCQILCLSVIGADALQDKPGTAAQLIRTSQLFQGPDPESVSVAELPKGTIVILQGERKNGFAHVTVEAADSGKREGWVPINDLNYRARESVNVEEEADGQVEEVNEEKAKPKKRAMVPRDEEVLLGRAKTFLYGVEGGIGLAILQPPTGNYLGPGIHAAAEVGYYLLPQMPVRVQVGYSNVSGSETNNTSIQLGFVDFTALASYLFDRFEIFAGGSYSMGIGIGALPTTISVGGAADLSNFYIVGGIGYHYLISDIAKVAFRLRYSMSVYTDPIFYQLVTGLVAFEIAG